VRAAVDTPSRQSRRRDTASVISSKLAVDVLQLDVNCLGGIIGPVGALARRLGST
jgi:hypothetical protein